MNIVDELNNEFSKQKSLYKVGQQPVAELEKYKHIAMVHIPEHTRSLSGSLLGYKTIP